MTVTAISTRRSTAAIGAEVTGLDLSAPLDEEAARTVRKALLDHQVLFFRDQPMDVDQQVAFARTFGEIDIAPVTTSSSPRPEVLVLDQVAPKGEGADSWHADNTYLEVPPKASILQALELPPVGGDTCFASMYAVYEALSPAFQRLLDGLTAVHTFQMMVERIKHVANASYLATVANVPPVVHPVVRVHPETGRKLINVNANWTSHIVELTRSESDSVLSLLYQHIRSPDHQVRFQWEPHSVAVWDNRSVQHYAVPDYSDRRVMQRVTIVGDRPTGPMDCHR